MQKIYTVTGYYQYGINQAIDFHHYQVQAYSLKQARFLVEKEIMWKAFGKEITSPKQIPFTVRKQVQHFIIK